MRMVVVVLACVIAAAGPAGAQDTREEVRAAEQAKKAAELHPYEPTRVERRILQVQNILTNQRPVYTYIGAVFPGGAFAFGPGFRHRSPRTGLMDAHGAWSIRNYKLVDTSWQLPALAAGRVRIAARANWVDAPHVGFFGLGNDSEPGDRTTYLYRTTTAGVSARVQAAPIVAVGASVDYMDVTTGEGSRGTSIEEEFSPFTTPGIGADPTYTRTRAFAEMDWRESPGYTTRGGLYHVDWSDYRQRDNGPFSFQRVDAEVDQFVPLLRANWVLAFRALTSITTTDTGREVPFFLMPALGGGSELRGMPSWRFRDRHRLLLTGEYRWRAGQFIDMALFLDAGKVTARRADLDLDDLNTSYGLGVRFHTPAATVVRVEVAKTSTDGLGLVFSFGPSF